MWSLRVPSHLPLVQGHGEEGGKYYLMACVLVGSVRLLLTDRAHDPEDSGWRTYQCYRRALRVVYGRQGGGFPPVIVWIPAHRPRSRTLTPFRAIRMQALSLLAHSVPFPERPRIHSFWGLR